jgi:hypothetical protein
MFLSINPLKGCAMAQVVRRRPLNAEIETASCYVAFSNQNN